MRTEASWLLLLMACGSATGVVGGPLDGTDNGSDNLADSGDDDEDDGAEAFSLEQAIDIDRLMEHLGALEDIAIANGDNRVYLSQGYLDSLDYIQRQLEDSGYDVEVEEYTITSYDLFSADVTIDSQAVDFSVLQYSAGGDVTASIQAVDLQIPPGAPNTSTSGCEAADFVGFAAGTIALIQRGSCTFSDKVHNAEDAGAIGVVILNEGQEGRAGVLEGVLDAGDPPTIPVVGVSYDTGVSLAAAQDTSRVRLDIDAAFIEQSDYNILTRTPGGDPSRAVLVGAHLDSVQAGAGINDNGSGSAAILEMALQMAAADYSPTNQVRFAWWGAEEQGLIGSGRHFFNELGDPDPEVFDDLDAYLNFDMLASGNGARYVYDGDGSAFPDELGVSVASGEIEQLFLDYFAERDLITIPTGMEVPTDSYWTVAVGLPTGGLFSGASEIKTPGQADAFDGRSGVAFDPCYHLACDIVDNVNPDLYQQLARGAAHVVQALAEREAPLARTARAAAVDPISPRLPRPVGCHDHVRWDR